MESARSITGISTAVPVSLARRVGNPGLPAPPVGSAQQTPRSPPPLPEPSTGTCNEGLHAVTPLTCSSTANRAITSDHSLLCDLATGDQRVSGRARAAPLCVVAMRRDWKWASSMDAFRCWAVRTHYSKAWRQGGEDVNELMELQRVVLGDLDKQISNLGRVLVGFSRGEVDVIKVGDTASDSHWALLVEEMNALLDVLQARVASLQDKHALHAAWTRRTRSMHLGFQEWRHITTVGAPPIREQPPALPQTLEINRQTADEGEVDRQIVMAHAVLCAQLLTRGFAIWFTQTACQKAAAAHAAHLARTKPRTQHKQCQFTSSPPHAVPPRGSLGRFWVQGVLTVLRERSLHRGLARWVEFTIGAIHSRLGLLQTERMARQQSEHHVEVGALRGEIYELRGECGAITARESEVCTGFVNKVHRIAAAAVVRIIAASQKRHLMWVHMRWRTVTAVRTASMKQRSPMAFSPRPSLLRGTPRQYDRQHDRQHDRQASDVLARAAERMGLAQDVENKSPFPAGKSPYTTRTPYTHKSPYVTRANSTPLQNMPLQKAIHLRQRLQEHAPRSVARTPPPPQVPEDVVLRGSAKTSMPKREKGALLRGLRSRLGQ